jgi:acyl-CoA thioesterase-1
MLKHFVAVIPVLLLTVVNSGCGRESDFFPRATARRARQAEQKPARSSAPTESAVTDDRPVIVAFGDSLTAGLGVDPGFSFPAVLERGLASKGYKYHVINAGVSGDTSSSGIVRLDSVLACKPKIVILALGANDGLRGLPVEVTRANLDQMMAALQSAGAKIVLAGMTLPPNYGADYIRSFEQVFVDLAEKYNAARIPFLREDVATVPARMQNDGLHPNVAGHKIVAANVMRALEPLVAEEAPLRK